MYNPSHLRQSSIGIPQPTSSIGQSPALAARITQKKLELENLKQLRDLSASLALQLRELEGKLSTLTDGTEAVATVLGNWSTVLQAINMASRKVVDGGGEGGNGEKEKKEMPEQLVRVPTGVVE